MIGMGPIKGICYLLPRAIPVDEGNLNQIIVMNAM